MRFIKNNYIAITLFIISVFMGVMALVTAIRLSQLKTTAPQNAAALTPTCSLIFTISDSTPREGALLPTSALQPSPTLIAQSATNTPTPQSSLTPTNIPSPSPTKVKPSPTSSPTPTKSVGTLVVTQTITPTKTPSLTPTKTPTPTKSLIAQAATVTPTPTPTLKTTPTKTPGLTTTPTVISPNVPIAGNLTPTSLVLILGIILIVGGYLKKKFSLFK